ncbi:hypothetical protein BUALT_Bualt09G0106700 [Buddleja alternifolia]|uniref:Glutaredoxin domain-containing protein n=1 Tax=Buddleja alternifolia TaxID=168488 RepID=A0AAV6X5W0_9LAMI|nr:hypothetical protein BUALT_Bualt09G0106700 [Buddleja alternifolia]
MKLKSISTPIWRPPLSLHPNTPIQSFQTSKQHKNLNISEVIIKDVEEDEFVPCPNADIQEKLTPSIKSKEDQVIASESMEDHITIEAEDNCPPGGKDIVVLYTTSLRGIRKTFEDCNTIRFLLQSFKIHFHERDVSMHLEYRDELWRVLGGRVVPPRLFIRGRFIGGADEVVGLHENGMLKNLLQGIPLISPSDGPCRGCGGMHFVMCGSCHGSRRVAQVGGQSNGSYVKCLDCNENGLVKCSVCN